MAYVTTSNGTPRMSAEYSCPPTEWCADDNARHDTAKTTPEFQNSSSL